MIKVYTEPKNKDLYGDYSFLIDVVLLGLSLVGSCISAYTEWFGFKSWNTTGLLPNLFPTLMIILVEASRFIIPLLVLTAFRLWYKFGAEWKTRLPPLIVLFLLALALTGLSVAGSEDGIKQKVEDKNAVVDSVNVDSTKYRLLMSMCESEYKSEKNRIESDVKAENNKALQQEKQKARQARQRISELKGKTAGWAVSIASTKKNVLQVAMGTLTDIEKEMQEEIKNRSNLATANYEACKASANDTLLLYTNLAETQNTVLIRENDETINRQTKVSNWAMYIGIVLIWVYSIAKGWLNYVSGREIKYTFGDEDKDLNFFQRLVKITTEYFKIGGNWVLMKYGTKLQQTKQQEQLRQQKIQQQKILQQQQTQAKAKAQQNALLLQQQQLDIQKAQMEVAKAKAAAEVAKAKAAAETARIEAETAASLATTKQRLERERMERKAKQEAANAERLANEQIEADRLKQQREQLQQEQQQLQQQQQEIEQQKQLLQQAKEIEQQKQLQSQQQVEVKQQLNTSLETIATTPTTSKVVDYQLVVNSLIDKHTSNGVLIATSKFTTPIRQWYDRWKTTEKKINNGSISAGRMAKAKQGVIDNKNKYIAAVETLKQHNIKCFFNKETNRVEFEKL